jgi:hypothetical protein
MNTPQATARKSSAAVPLWVQYLLALAATFVLYGATAQRGVAWQDSAIFQWRIALFQPAADPDLGIALSHPLLIVLGKGASMLPMGETTWRMNLLSALAGAVAVANVMLLVRRLLGRVWPAVIAAGALAVAHTMWWLATITESQTLYLALFTAELHVLLSLVRAPSLGAVVLLGLINGLAMTAHNLALLALPCYGVAVLVLCCKRRLPAAAPLAMAAAWLVGSLGLWVIVLTAARTDGVGAAVHSMLFGARWQQGVLRGSAAVVSTGLKSVAYNFPNLILPLAAVGVWNLWRRLGGMMAWSLAYLAGIYLLFAIRYDVPDQFMFFLPFYALTAVLAGLGLATVAARRRWLLVLAAASVALTPVLYACAPRIVASAGLSIPGRRDLPYRDAARYWLVPWKHNEDSAQRFAAAALGNVPPGATIIADATAYWPLRFVQRFDGVGQQVRLLHVESDIDGRPPITFVVSNLRGYYPKWLDSAAELRRDEPSGLYRVVWRQ